MSPVVILLREYKDSHTLGTLILPSGEILRTMERPWLDNARNMSCIPEGQYPVSWLPRSASGRYKRVWHVRDVSDRSGVLFHKGNYWWHSKGCILPGLRIGTLGKFPAVLGSGAAVNQMRRELGGQDFTLVVTSLG